MKNKINYYLLESRTVNIFFFLMLLALPFVNKFSKFTVVLFLIVFFKFINEYKDFILPRTHKIFLSLFFTLIAVSNLLSGTMLHNLKKDIYLGIFILIYVATKYFIEKKILKISTIIYAILIPMTIYMIDGLYQYYSGFDFIFHNHLTGGINSVSRNRNIFAFVMFLYFAVLFYLSLEWKEKKIPIYILLCLSFITLFLTLSRQMWISLFLFMAIVLFFKYKVISFRGISFILGLFLVLVGIFYLFPDLQHRLSDLEHMRSSGRVDYWKVLLSQVSNAPIFGHSMQSPMHVMVDGKEYFYSHHIPFVYAHNLTIGILYNFGILGIILYVIFLGYFLKKIFTCKDSIVKPYFLAIFIAIMFVQQQLGASMLIHKLIGPSIMIFFALLSSYCTDESFLKQLKNRA